MNREEIGETRKARIRVSESTKRRLIALQKAFGMDSLDEVIELLITREGIE